MCLSSAVLYFPRNGAVPSVMYTTITPVLNPFIYNCESRTLEMAQGKLEGVYILIYIDNQPTKSAKET
ncbi:Olfactory receptor 7E24 [Sciurus carolinensis]|uniref:Olfactory receptor 7E24 n=1 Tax=Sciurus carolinensis TaxID=30640 RepID=A0AA41NKB2_SCICA|nr:Olfactory receptor 7E24 [Sciurus carolinensis]